MDNNTEKDTDVILEVKDLKTYFKTGPHKVVKAVEGVNFSLRKGKVLGIIGERDGEIDTEDRGISGLHSRWRDQVQRSGYTEAPGEGDEEHPWK